MTLQPNQKLTIEQIHVLLSNSILDENTKNNVRQNYGLEIALDQIVTVDAQMLELKKQITLLSARSESVLVLGETGTGKTQIARALHGSRTGKFIQVNCSALPGELIHSELFGHRKGSFTGAIEDRVGKFIAANNGTLFLDEIGDMDVEMQAKLLIALQERVITPLGSNDNIAVNCRVVSATNKDIKELVNKNLFREDLFYRLATFELKTTPLRSRKQDIYEAFDTLYDKEKKIPNEVREKIAEMQLWGNYRELEHICLRYIVLGKLEEHGTRQKELLQDNNTKLD